MYVYCCRSMPVQLLGAAAARRRLLGCESSGWEVVPVPLHLWAALGTDPGDQFVWLSNELLQRLN